MNNWTNKQEEAKKKERVDACHINMNWDPNCRAVTDFQGGHSFSHSSNSPPPLTSLSIVLLPLSES